MMIKWFCEISVSLVHMCVYTHMHLHAGLGHVAKEVLYIFLFTVK